MQTESKKTESGMEKRRTRLDNDLVVVGTTEEGEFKNCNSKQNLQKTYVGNSQKTPKCTNFKVDRGVAIFPWCAILSVKYKANRKYVIEQLFTYFKQFEINADQLPSKQAKIPIGE